MMVSGFVGWHLLLLLLSLLIPIAVVVGLVFLVVYLVRRPSNAAAGGSALEAVSRLSPEQRVARAAELRAKPYLAPHERAELIELTRLGL